MLLPLEGRVRNVPVEKRWAGENKRAEMPLFGGNFDVRSPDRSPFQSSGRDRHAFEILSRLQASANRTFSPLENSSTYTKRLNLPDRPSISLDDRFGQPLFLKNPRDSIQIGSRDVVDLPRSSRWNATFSDFVDWWAPDYEQALNPEAPELSLQDINRYQFRSSHSSAPGVPVRKAGSDG